MIGIIWAISDIAGVQTRETRTSASSSESGGGGGMPFGILQMVQYRAGVAKKKAAYHSCHQLLRNRTCSCPTSSCSALTGFFPCPFSSALRLSSSSGSEVGLFCLEYMMVGKNRTRRRLAFAFLYLLPHPHAQRRHGIISPVIGKSESGTAYLGVCV